MTKSVNHHFQNTFNKHKIKLDKEKKKQGKEQLYELLKIITDIHK